MTTTAPSSYVSSLLEARAEARAEKAADRANKFAVRAAAKADAARKETAVFAAFSAFEKSEFLKACYARYNSLRIEGFNWASTFALSPEDFAGPLFERQQVEWLKDRARLLAPLEEVFGA